MSTQLSLTLALIGFSTLALNAKAPDTMSAAKAIDSLLAKDWEVNKVTGNPAADDNIFVRRVYLDTIGRIPTTREAESFLSDKASDKRAKLIDKLLASEGYVQHFFNYWADVLRVTSNGNQTGGITGAAYTRFVKESLRSNKPYDKFVSEMIAAQGKAWDNGAIGYYMRDRGMPLDNMANTVRVFLGTRIECAQCHNHPFDKWTQMQFYKMAAFTFGMNTQDYYGGTMNEVRDLLREQEQAVRASIQEPKRPQQPNPPRIKGKMAPEQQAKLKADYAAAMEQYKTDKVTYEAQLKDVTAKRKEAQDKLRREQRNYQEAFNDIRDTMRYTSVSMDEKRLPQLPHDYKYDDAKPKERVNPGSMMGHECSALPGETPLEAYARWLTSKENPRFTSVIANRLWKKAFGLALIEPLDEIMDNSVPAIPAMQKHLEKLMVDLNYDMKAYLRVLFNTRAYQSEVSRQEITPGMAYHFTGPILRRMTAEQMWDSFVTLVNPNPDMINADVREGMEQRILQAQKNADSIEILTPDEALKGLKVTAAVYDKNQDQIREEQQKVSELRTEAKALESKADKLVGVERDKVLAEMKKLKEEQQIHREKLSKAQGEGRKTTFAQLLVPGQKKLFEKVTGKPYQTASLPVAKGDKGSVEAPAMMAGESMMMVNGARMEKVNIPGYDRKEKTKEDRKAEEEARTKAFAEEAEFYGIPEKQRKDYYRARQQQIRDTVRAAEVESPAPRGHYLREFGQSDRETIENANNEASVPQALAMMNGALLPQITSSYSQLMLTVSKAQYPDDKVEAAYMTILSRKPTSKEKEAWLKAQDAGLSDMKDLIFSLLNTQQFIFIQ